MQPTASNTVSSSPGAAATAIGSAIGTRARSRRSARWPGGWRRSARHTRPPVPGTPGRRQIHAHGGAKLPGDHDQRRVQGRIPGRQRSDRGRGHQRNRRLQGPATASGTSRGPRISPARTRSPQPRHRTRTRDPRVHHDMLDEIGSYRHRPATRRAAGTEGSGAGQSAGLGRRRPICAIAAPAAERTG